MIQIILCDDNDVFLEKFRTEIHASLKKTKTTTVVHTYSSAEEIPTTMMADADILFLDIDFTDKNYTGIDIAKKIREVNDHAVIVFVTNYIEYAPDGYEVQAFRYLLKSDIESKLERCLQQILEKMQSVQETVLINSAGETMELPLSDILYIESQLHNAIIYIQAPGFDSAKEVRVYSSLANLEQQLSEKGFLRVQKSYLVNMRRIAKYQCAEALLDNGTVLKVSQKMYAEQKKKYLLWKGHRK